MFGGGRFCRGAMLGRRACLPAAFAAAGFATYVEQPQRCWCGCAAGGVGRPSSRLRGWPLASLGPASCSSLVTDWGDPEKAASLEAEYKKADVVEQRRRMVQLLQPAQGERILDVGCGPGYLLEGLAAAVGPSGFVEGVDPSEAMRAMASRRLEGTTNTAVRDGAAEALPFGDGTFDAVVLSQVLLYVEDLPIALAEVRRVLRTGGRVVLCETDWNGLVVNTGDQARFERIFAACIGTFVHPFLPPKLPGLLAGAGMRVCEVETVAMVTAGHSRADSFMANWAYNVVPKKCKGAALAAEDVQGWLEEQRSLDKRGEFFACIHRFLFLARVK